MVVSWVVIVACVAALIVRPRWLDHSRATPDAPPTVPPLSETPSSQLELTSRYAVGTKAVGGAAAASNKDFGKLVAQVDALTGNPVDEFRAIPVVGELSGAKAALDRLDRLETRYPLKRLRADADALRVIYTRGADALTPEQARGLVENHKWFGRLAVSYGLPNDDPRRVAALRPAGRSLLLAGLFMFLGLGAVFTGLVLLILGIVLAVQGRLGRPRYVPPPVGVAGPLVEAFAIYLGGMVGLSQLLGRLFPEAGIGLTFVLYLLLPAVLAYLRLRGPDWGWVRESLGLTRGRGFWREVGVGLVGYLAGLPVLVLGMLVTFVLMRYSGESAAHPISRAPFGEPRELMMLFLLAAVGAPIVEEIMFRGALLGHLRARLPWWAAAPVVSLIFAAIHPQGWVAIPVLGAIAMTLAALREWRGSLIAPMTAHAFNNGVVVLFMGAMLG